MKKLTGYPVVEDDTFLTANRLLKEALIEEVREIGEQGAPASEVLTISERGFKTRIVTKSHGAIVALAHHIRRWMSAGLRTDPAIVEVLAGNHREAVESLFRPPPEQLGNPSFVIDEGLDWVLSADLKTATDLIGTETYEALVEGVLDSRPGRELPKWAKDLFRTCVGRQLLVYPELKTHIVSRRGALMGLPTTWPLLCLANLAWWSGGSRKDGARLPHLPVRICGDDLVAKGQRDRISRYEQRAQESGAKFSNRAKHMVLKTGGVFTEEVFFTTGPVEFRPEGPIRKWAGPHVYAYRGYQIRNLISRWSDAFPIRGLLGTMRSDLTGTEAPYWSAIGPAIEQMMAHRSMPARRRMLRTLRFCHPELQAFMAQAGLAGQIHVPRQFGGLGIPRPEMWDWVPRLTKESWLTIVAAKSLAMGLEPAGDMAQLSRPYSDLASKMPWRTVAGRAAEFGMQSRYHFQEVRPNTELPADSVVFPGTVNDLLETVEGNVARDLFFLSDDPFASELAMHRNAMQTAKKLKARLTVARRTAVQEMGGWLVTKHSLSPRPDSAVPPAANNATWQHLLTLLGEKADKRVAFLRPNAPRDVRIPFERLEDILSKSVSLSGRPGATALWSLPLREWPSRPLDKALMGPTTPVVPD
jgi:hypothetical protein